MSSVLKALSSLARFMVLRKFLVFYIVLLMIMSFMVILLPSSVNKSFAVETLSVEVYWDAAYTLKVTSIEWGELTPGSKSGVTIFARNEELTVPCFLFLWTDNWTPSIASRYITLSWDYDGKPVAPGKSVAITLTMQISYWVYEVTDFTYEVIILATEHLVGDLNHDGTVNMRDGRLVGLVFGSTPASKAWNPEADYNNDFVVNMRDLSMFAQNFGLNG